MHDKIALKVNFLRWLRDLKCIQYALRKYNLLSKYQNESATSTPKCYP